MHEMSILMEVLRVVDEIADKNDIPAVKSIVIESGELSGVVPAYMTEYFPIIVADMPRYKNTELNMITIPGRAICDDCGRGFNVVEHEGRCPNCGSENKTVISGEEFNIREIVVPDTRDKA